mgnify:CR=1 FL=1
MDNARPALSAEIRMPDIPLPAPIWRRLAALFYDGLLYLALIMAGLVLATPFVAFFVAQDASTPLHNYSVLQGYAYVMGLIFFGWSWTRGGQTLGMRVWRLQVRRTNGTALRAPIALLRFTAGAALCVAALWLGKHFGPTAYGAVLLGYVPCLLSARGRAFNDLAAGTEVVLLPRPGAPATS